MPTPEFPTSPNDNKEPPRWHDPAACSSHTTRANCERSIATRSRPLACRSMARCAMLRCMTRALLSLLLIVIVCCAVPIFIAVQFH